MKRRIGSLLCAAALLWQSGCATAGRQAADPEIIRLSQAAHAAYAAGLSSKAAALYSQALERSRLADAPGEAARNAYNLGLCRMAAGETAEALRLFQEACVLLEPESPGLDLVLAAGAEAAMRTGDCAAAQVMAGRAVALSHDRTARCQASLVMAEIAAGEGNWSAAKRSYATACAGGDEGMPPSLCARREAIAARLMAGGALQGDVAGALQRQAEYLRTAGLYREMAAALESAGDALRDSGRHEAAFGCYERAARSLHAGGDGKGARRIVAKMAGMAARLDGARFGERLSMATRMAEEPQARTEP